MQREVPLVARDHRCGLNGIVSLTSGATVASLGAGPGSSPKRCCGSFTVLGKSLGVQLDEDPRSKFCTSSGAATALRKPMHGYWQISASILLTTGRRSAAD